MDGNFTLIVVQDFYWLNMMFNEGEKIVFKDGETVFKNGVRSSKYKSAKYFIERNKLKYYLEEYAGDIKYADIMYLPGGKSEIHCYNEEAFKKDMEDKKTNIYQKLQKCRVEIQKKNLSQSGINNYSNYNTYKDGAVINEITTIYPFKSGIVVFIGEKEDYGNTVIIQGMDGIDYWYGNITNLGVKLYDYVETKNIIGQAKDNKLYVLFMKDNKILDYNDYL